MRSLAKWPVLVLVLGVTAVGCGGANGGTRAAATHHGSTTPSGQAIVARVARAAVEVCQCRNAPCADGAVERLRLGLRGRDDTMLTMDEQSAMFQHVARLDRCRARLIGRGEQAARVAERWAVETCACVDDGCRELASQRGADELRRYGDAEASQDEIARIVVASRRVRRCVEGDGEGRGERTGQR